MYFCLAFEDEADEAAAAAAAEAATAAAGGILNIGGRGKPPKRGWYLRGVCRNLAAILVYKSNCAG